MQDRGHYIFVSCSSNLYLDQSISLQKEKDISCRSFELVRLNLESLQANHRLSEILLVTGVQRSSRSLVWPLTQPQCRAEVSLHELLTALQWSPLVRVSLCCAMWGKRLWKTQPKFICYLSQKDAKKKAIQLFHFPARMLMIRIKQLCWARLCIRGGLQIYLWLCLCTLGGRREMKEEDITLHHHYRQKVMSILKQTANNRRQKYNNTRQSAHSEGEFQ